VNGELVKYDGVWPTNYSKGLPHDKETGLVAPAAFEKFVSEINTANSAGEAYHFNVPIGPRDAANAQQKGYRPASYMDRTDDAAQFSFKFTDGNKVKVRNWESPRAGHVYDLEGPDAAALAISSFPKLGSKELDGEIAELYAMAYLRDIPVVEFEMGASAKAEVSPRRA
jgi:hypothetical protein